VLHARPDPLLRRAATGSRRRARRPREVEEVRTLRLVELQGTGQRLQNAFGNPAHVPALEAGVVVDADPGKQRHPIRSPEDLADDDWPKNNPRFTEGNFEQNLRIVDEVEAVGSEVGATPAQVALAWLLAQGDDIAPIPGTKRVSRVEENMAADRIELTAEQIARLNDLIPATGERHDEANMSIVDR
jgi:hypothetical protein